MRPVSVGKNLIPAVKTTMFKIPTKHNGILTFIHAYNGTSSAKHFTIWWFDKSQNTEVAFITNYDLAAKTYFHMAATDGGAIVMEEGDEIRVEIEANAVAASCVCTVELFPKTAAEQFQDFGF